MDMSRTAVRNGLLRAMPAEDFTLLAPYLVRIDLPVRFPLHEAGYKIKHVYFPEDGIISIVALTLNGRQCEVGIFGREGMSEIATVLGTDHSPHSAYVQVPGTAALKLPVAVLNDLFETSRTLRRHLLHYAQAMMIQLSSSIAAAGLTIEQRLARWLLMCHDRIDGDDIHLTHEFVSMMLNVRRAVTASVLSSIGAVEQGRSLARPLLSTAAPSLNGAWRRFLARHPRVVLEVVSSCPAIPPRAYSRSCTVPSPRHAQAIPLHSGEIC